MLGMLRAAHRSACCFESLAWWELLPRLGMARGGPTGLPHAGHRHVLGTTGAAAAAPCGNLLPYGKQQPPT